MVLNDLRIECDGLIAQIDHLLISRFLYFWLCETKSIASDVSINEHGEFGRYLDGRPKGIDSPIEQNNAHLRIFGRLLGSGTLTLPTRLSFPIKRELRSLVLISKDARIFRPQVNFKGLDTVIKIDQIMTTVDKTLDRLSLRELLNIISTNTLEHLARQIAALHKPAQIDWLTKFGIDDASANDRPNRVHAQRVNVSGSSTKRVQATEPAQVCVACGVSVSSGVVAYCKANCRRFRWAVYCMACQQGAARE